MIILEVIYTTEGWKMDDALFYVLHIWAKVALDVNKF